MQETVDYKAVFENLPVSVAICTPIYTNENTLADILVDEVNKQFLVITKKAIKSGSLLSEIKDSLTPDIDWLAFAAQAQSETAEKAFYSLVAKAYLKITASATENGKLAVCLTNISKEKETEQQLRRQNARLEELTAKL